MSAATFTLLFVLLGAIWYFLHRRAISRWINDRKLPPGPAGLPVVGNLHKLGKLPHRSLRDLAEKYGSIMSIKLGSEPAIVVSSPQAAELFLKKHDAAFSSRPKIQASEYLFYGAKAMAFTEQGEYWRGVRKLCSTELLSGAKIDSYGGMRRQEVAAVVKSLKAAAAGGDVVDLSETVEVLAEKSERNSLGNHIPKLTAQPIQINPQLSLSGIDMRFAHYSNTCISRLGPTITEIGSQL